MAQSVTNFIHALKKEGILGDNFNNLEMVRNEGNKTMFVLDILNSYCHEAEECIATLTRYMSEPVINYAQVQDSAHHLKSRTSGIGGCRVVQACLELEKACHDRNRDSCLESFKRLNEEYGTLHESLRQICAIEKAWLANKARRRGQPESDRFSVNSSRA